MAHIGQEGTFERVALFGLLLGLAQGLFHPLLRGNDAGRADHLPQVAVRFGFRNAAQYLHPFVFPVVVPVDGVDFEELGDAAFDQTGELFDHMLPIIGMNAQKN